MISIDEITLNSLIFFNFGFMLDEPTDYIVKKIIHKAVFDATNQGAFNSKIDKDDIKTKNAAKTAKNNLIEGLADSLLKRYNNNNFEKFKNQEEFNKWHLEKCNQISKYFENENIEIFSFGNAQKVLNMTLKYLYMLSNIDDISDECDEKLLTNINKDAEFFHIPIDSYIIDKLADYEDVKLPILNNKSKKLKEYAHPYIYVKPWSTWEQKEYENLIDDLPDKLLSDKRYKNLLDWESDKWIESAKNRRVKEDYLFL